MAFSVPTFNIHCEVWSGPWLSKSFRFETECNLALGRRVQQSIIGNTDPYFSPISLQMDLLLPKGTDIRDLNQADSADVIECPTGSGRWYIVNAYDDVGGGFDNEYRLAILTKISQGRDVGEFLGLFWPRPCPPVGP